MGLDSIELLIEVEKAFSIKIPDQEAERIITVGDFHNSVWKHLEGKHSDKCQSQKLFYQLRRSFVDSFKFSKADFKLSTSLNDIFPEDNRKQAYLNFSNSINIEFPDLVLPKPWAIFLNTIGIITICGGLGLSIILINYFDYSKWTLLFSAIGIGFTYLISKILNAKRTVIKPSLVRDFTQKTLSINYPTLMKENGVNRKDVESVINHIIADKAGLELNEISPEKKIGDHLGIG